MKKVFDISALKNHLEAINQFNETKLEDIELFEDGETIELSPNFIEHWKFVGLLNIGIIKYNSYKPQDQNKFVGEMMEMESETI